MAQDDDNNSHGSVTNVAVILALGIAISLNIVTVALLYAAIIRLGAGSTVGLSENGVQLLTGWGGGIIGVLGSYIGFTFGKTTKNGNLLPDTPRPRPPQQVPKQMGPAPPGTQGPGAPPPPGRHE
jgi:hypothetical protein